MRLILTDIDGTILPQGSKVVSERTRAAFKGAVQAGHAVGLVSGRGPGWIPTFFDGDESCYNTVIATNGLNVYYQGECLLERKISAEQVAGLYEAIKDIPHAGLVSFEGLDVNLLAGTKEDLLAAFPRYGESCVAASLPTEPVAKINAFVNGSMEATRELAAVLGSAVPTLDIDVPQQGFNNIMPKGVNKGTSVLFLAEKLGIAKEDIFVFGDGENDLTMMRAVENSVAVSNAVPAVAEVARWHIGACKDDAVAAAIETLSAGEFPFSE